MPGRMICFVCGSPGAETTLRVRQNDREPYFPFLLHHDPPKGARLPSSEGVIDSCAVCYMFLTQQWESYERSKTPAVKRLYWLKRSDNGSFTGAEMRIQGEYIAQVMGLQYPPGVDERGSPENTAAEREYSNHSNNNTSAIMYSRSNSNNQSHRNSRDYSPRPHNQGKSSALDLSTPKKHSDSHLVTESKNKCESSNSVCYICGQLYCHQSNNFLSAFYQGNGEPFFPVLERITPSAGAEYMTRSGQVHACNQCKNMLFQQWQAFEMSGTPLSHRNFKLPRETESRKMEIKTEDKYANNVSASSYFCYICGCSYITDHVRLLNTLPPKRATPAAIFFPFVRELKRPANAEPLRSDGTVIVCIKCYSHLSYQWEIQESEGVPVYCRQYSLHFLNEKSSPKGTVSEMLNQTGGPSGERIEPLNIRISSASPMHSNTTSGTNCPQGLLAIASQAENATQSISRSRSSSFSGSPNKSQDIVIDSKTTAAEAYTCPSSISKTVPHPLQQVTEIPNRICFLCGEKCIIHKMRHLCSYPARHEAKHTNSQVEPFFPFLANCTPAPGAESLTEDGTVIVCKLCFHSVLRQWTEYEQSSNPADSNRWLRKYHLPNYICYVCAVENERKFTRTISVENFNFLKEHKAPKGSLVIDDGRRVAVCKSCAYSLMQQFSEYERMGVPHQLRRFNWMQKLNQNIPDMCNDDESQDNIKEDDESSHEYKHMAERGYERPETCQDDSLHHRRPSETEQEVHRQRRLSFGGKEEENSQQGPLGSKPPPLNMMSPAGSKHQRNTATVSPLHHVTSPTNGVTSLGGSASLNASRTSSFAAALRKLANQAKDPPDEGPVKTASSTSPRDTTSKSGPPPLMYSTSTTLTSPPVVTIAPTQSHPSLLASDNRPSLERLHSNSSMFESVSGKMDRPHSSASRDDDRASSRDNLSQSARRLTPHSTPGAVSPMSAREEAPARGFQPYRPGDDLRPPMSSSLALDHAAAAAAAAYSYPAAFLPPHAFPHPAFRFDDPLLLERYRMMQSPYMPYPQGMMPHPSLHPLLAAGGRYPPDLFPPQFPPFSQQSRMSDHRSPSMLSERQRMEEEKQREMEREREKEREREREREKDREMAIQRERQRALEREAEKQRDRDRLACQDRDRLPSRDRDRLPSHEDMGKESLESSLSAKFGSIIQGTPKGLGIADRYPRVTSSSSSTAGLGRKDERKIPKEEYGFPSNHSQQSSHRGSIEEHKKRMSLVNPLREGGKPRPPPLVSPRAHGDPQSRSSKSNDTGLFRPFDSNQMMNGYDNHNRRDRENSTVCKVESEEKKHSHERHLLNPKYEKDTRETTHKTGSSVSAFQTFANHISKMESDAQILSRSVNRDASYSIPHSAYSTPLNVPSYNTSLIQSGLHRSDQVVGTDYSKSSGHESQNCVSKLDLDEKRKNESRDKTCCSDSECDLSNEEDSQEKQLLISSGPPLKLDTSPKKIKLLSELGLTTFSNKKDADFEKFRKRRRRMKERSVSPVSVESGPPTPLKSQYRPEDLCMEPDYKLKCQFLSQHLHLEPVPHDTKKVHDVIKKACDEEKKRRLNVDVPICVDNHSLKTGVKRKLEDDVFSPSQIDSDFLPDRKLNLFHRDTNTNRLGKSTSSPSLDSLERSKSDSSAVNLKRPNMFGKSFVQEFHESVLQTTRQKEMKRLSGESQKITDLSPTKSMHMLPWQPMSLEAWPGVDGIMETYQKYHQGEKLERQVLLDRNRKLREENAKLNTAAAQLSQRMEELLRNKRQLEELRCYNQERVDVLKSSIKKLK
ncbi:genetic suppressor element 1-like isoform X2 [Mercenaria mercenaria]|uniref:genetic suppressor element 1-like isoform X2 n=1 Tax=Mercenaria mercenaria TaxID=6596 RepID=UPI00234F88AE|nr:genetic suppressor element 1-like isoform X2 [Mercenaria mercenaria]